MTAKWTASAYCGVALADRLVRAPGGPRDDLRRAGERERAQGHPLGGALDVVGAQARHLPAGAEADGGGRARPDEAAEVPAGQPVLGARRVRVLVGVGGAARRSSGRRAARAEEDAARAAPVQAEQVEPGGRRGGEHAAAVERNLARGHADARAGGRRRDEEQGECDEESLHRQRGPSRGAQGALSAARAQAPPWHGAKCNPSVVNGRLVRAGLVALRPRGGGARTRCGRRQRRRLGPARARDPLRARPRGQPGHPGLPDEQARRRGERALRRCGDPARHPGRALELDEDDLHGGAEREAAGDRLRLPRRRAGRVGRASGSRRRPTCSRWRRRRTSAPRRRSTRAARTSAPTCAARS